MLSLLTQAWSRSCIVTPTRFRPLFLGKSLVVLTFGRLLSWTKTALISAWLTMNSIAWGPVHQNFLPCVKSLDSNVQKNAVLPSDRDGQTGQTW